MQDLRALAAGNRQGRARHGLYLGQRALVRVAGHDADRGDRQGEEEERRPDGRGEGVGLRALRAARGLAACGPWLSQVR